MLLQNIHIDYDDLARRERTYCLKGGSTHRQVSVGAYACPRKRGNIDETTSIEVMEFLARRSGPIEVDMLARLWLKGSFVLGRSEVRRIE